MKNKKIISAALACTIMIMNVPLLATEETGTQSIFSSIFGTIKKQLESIKNTPEIASLAKKAHAWGNEKFDSAKKFWNKSDTLHKTMYGSIALAAVVASPLLLVSKVRKTLAVITFLVTGAYSAHYAGTKTEFGKSTIKNITDGTVKAYKAIVEWGKKELGSVSYSRNPSN